MWTTIGRFAMARLLEILAKVEVTPGVENINGLEDFGHVSTLFPSPF